MLFGILHNSSVWNQNEIEICSLKKTFHFQLKSFVPLSMKLSFCVKDNWWNEAKRPFTLKKALLSILTLPTSHFEWKLHKHFCRIRQYFTGSKEILLQNCSNSISQLWWINYSIVCLFSYWHDPTHNTSTDGLPYWGVQQWWSFPISKCSLANSSS